MYITLFKFYRLTQCYT